MIDFVVNQDKQSRLRKVRTSRYRHNPLMNGINIMDIFEESLSPLGVSVAFDENNLFSCEINQESTEGRGRAPWQLTVYRDQDDISLAISIVLGTPLPDNPTPDFITSLGEQAIEPLRGGVGIGIYPEPLNLPFTNGYNSLANQPVLSSRP